jgi:hypothetical protein
VTDVQAEPVETAMRELTAASRLSPSTPSNETFSRFGTTRCASPLRSTPPIAAKPRHKRSRRSAMRRLSVTDISPASCNANPMPTI